MIAGDLVVETTIWAKRYEWETQEESVFGKATTGKTGTGLGVDANRCSPGTAGSEAAVQGTSCSRR